ncbi:MAG: N-acetylmuramoyl-L-alanine amidase [Acidobacteria bacterium]|nr:N-acetylmuramoyl-L-alanine amidase [Acidobacteriota bacterium]
MRATATTVIILLLVLSQPQAQGTPPGTPLTLVTREGRRPVPTTVLSGQELIALDDLASLFQVSVREDTLAGGLTITYRGRTIVASTDQPMASVAGRVVALPAPAVRAGRRWLVPLEFLPRALGPIYDQRIDLRRPARLLVVGDLRVPRVTARIDAAGPPTRATIEIAPAAPVALAVDGGRVIVRIDADALDLALPTGGGGLIEQVRAGDQPNSVTVVLSGRAGPARAAATEADAVARVAIEVPSIAPPTAAAPATPLPPPTSEPASPLPVLTASRPVLQTIVIDPGHGGEDVGARGAGGTEEKQITLDVARRLRTIIEARLGVRVVLTRDEDRAISLDERAAVANNGKADLFLSLHVNASVAPTVAGVEVFHLRLDREGEDARRAAETQAVSLPVLGGATRTIDVVRWDLAQARHVKASAVLAGILEEELQEQAAMGPRPLQEAPLRVLTGANMPAALVEMGYITNRAQENLLRSDTYQASLAQAIYDAILRFREYLEEGRTP